MKKPFSSLYRLAVILCVLGQSLIPGLGAGKSEARERMSIDDNWRFAKGDPTNSSVSLLYDVRQEKTIRHLAEAEADGNSFTNESAGPKESGEAAAER